MKLFTGAGGAVTGPSVAIREGLNRNKHQLYTLFVWGNFGAPGATVTLQISPDNVNWFGTAVSITQQGATNVEFRANFVRAVSTGGTGSALEALLL